MRLSELRDAVADQLRSIDGLTVSTHRVSAIDAPHAVVSISAGRYDSTMARGADDLSLQIIVYVTRADDADGLALLDEFVAGYGDKSIKVAAEQAEADGLSFVRVREFQIGTTGTPDGAEFLAATFDVDAVVSGT